MLYYWCGKDEKHPESIHKYIKYANQKHVPSNSSESPKHPRTHSMPALFQDHSVDHYLRHCLSRVVSGWEARNLGPNCRDCSGNESVQLAFPPCQAWNNKENLEDLLRRHLVPGPEWSPRPQLPSRAVSSSLGPNVGPKPKQAVNQAYNILQSKPVKKISIKTTTYSDGSPFRLFLAVLWQDNASGIASGSKRGPWS